MVKDSTVASHGRRKRWGVRGLARCLLTGLVLAGGLTPAWGATPAASQVLKFRPRQEGVVCTTPTAAEEKDCKVELVKGKAGSGWSLKDGSGNLLRRFDDSNGDGRIDVWSYYKDGVEVYREVDTSFNGKPDQYRWLNTAGARWGVDQDKDGTIDSWKVISPEELSQEVLRALVTKNFAQLQALMITDAELKQLEMPTEQADAIRELRKGAQAKFQATVTKLTKLSPKAVWIHLETGAPQCVPAEQTGGRSDLIKHTRGTVLVDATGTNEWFQTGPMIQVGTAWRLVDAPAPGATAEDKKDLNLDQDPRLAKLVEELTAHDKNSPPATPGPNAAAAKHHLARADILEKIVATVKPQERDPWIRQVADSLSGAAQASPPEDKAAPTRLASLEKQLVAAVPGSTLAGYVAFRGLQAEYSTKLAAAKDFNEVQKEWMEKLSKFVQTYPKADDTPDALLQLGMVCEFLNKEVEAKNWYGQISKTFPEKPQAAKGQGAIRRLEMEGTVMKLAGPQVTDASAADIEQFRGKYVVVYYWASWNSQCAADFAKIKTLLDGNKDLALLCVNLDNTVDEAKAFLKKGDIPGTHLYQAGGLEGKLAVEYGVMVLPNLFLVGKDGKVLSRTVQISNLEEEIKKQSKK